MPHLEPTYLRYIYDGLVKGSIHPENAAELPEGLIGLYEEAFDERTSVVKRQKLLQRFAIWALLKKEVSTSFVADVLGEPEEEILNFISTYSAWFNSPESGKYQLYHERLKVYLLQKLSEQEIYTLHEKLIARLEQAIEEQKADEFEWYGLEFLTGHLGVAAMLNGDGKKLIDLAYSQKYWQRQLKISKGYTWTKNGLKAVMTWASKYNEDEVIECGLQMVDLHHQEQNAAPQIVALVAEGDFDSALKRIEQFGGNDKEGLQRKFILYMLCLMELTLLDSKEKSFRKEGIEKLLKHLDEQLPVDHSVLNWNDFFPSYLMFKVACCLEDVDYFLLFDRTSQWDTNWIEQKGQFSDQEIDVLFKLNTRLTDSEKSNRIQNQSPIEQLNCKVFFILSRADIFIALYTQGKYSDSYKILADVLESLTEIPSWDVERRTFTLLEIFTKFTRIIKEDDLAFLLKDALYLALREDEDIHMLIDTEKQKVFAKISSGYLRCGRIKEAFDIANTYLEDTIFSGGPKFSNSIKEIARTHASIGNIDDAKQLLLELPTDSDENLAFKCEVLGALSTECAVHGRIEEAISFMSDAKLLLEGIYFDWDRHKALKAIAFELARQKNWDEALEIARKIPKNEWLRSSALCAIAGVNSSSLNYENSKEIINEAIISASEIDDSFRLIEVQCEICDFYIKNRDFNSALILQKKIPNDLSKSSEKVLNNIYRKMSINPDHSDVYSALLNYSVISTTKTTNTSDYLRNISINLASKGKLEKAKNLRNKLIDTSDKNASLHEIYLSAIDFLKTTGPDDKRSSLNYIIESAEKLSDQSDRDKAFRIIIPEIADSGQMELAVKFANESSSFFDQNSLFCTIAQKLHETGKTDEADKLLNQVFKLSERLTIYERENLIIKISSVYISIGNYAKAKELLNEMLKLDSSMLGYDTILERNALQFASMNDIEKSVEIIKKIKKEVFPGEAYLKIYDILINNRKLNGIEILTEAAIEKSKEESFTHSRIYRTLKIADKLYVFGAKSNADKIIQDCVEELRKIKEEFLRWYKGKYSLSNDFIFGSDYLIDSLIRQNRLDQLSALACEILVIREDIWFVIGKSLYKNKNFNDTLNIIKELKDPQIINSIIEGISIAVSADYKVSEDFIAPFLKLNSNNITSKEHLLKLHALNQLFFEELPEEKIQRFNRTLNIQWAIDIKNQLPN